MKVILIDRANADKIVCDFQTKKEAVKYLKEVFASQPRDYHSFKYFMNDFFFISPNSKLGVETKRIMASILAKMYLHQVPKHLWEYA